MNDDLIRRRVKTKGMSLMALWRLLFCRQADADWLVCAIRHWKEAYCYCCYFDRFVVLSKRYSVIYLDGMYVKLKRQNVASEVVYVAMGIDEAGRREILSFGIGGKESANGWRDVLRDLYKRGAHEVLLGVFDGLAGLEEAFRETYPQADVQRCITHKMRNTLPKIRDKDKAEFVTATLIRS